MKIPTTAMLSLVLVLTSLTAFSKPVSEVYVTNLPLDEQGNLKVSFAKATKVITVVKDLNLSWVTGSRTIHFPNTISVDGFSEVYVFASVSYSTIGQWQFGYNPIGSLDGIEVEIPYESGSTSTQRSDAYSPLPLSISARFTVWAPEFKMRLWTYGNLVQYPNGWMLVSVSLYLRN